MLVDRRLALQTLMGSLAAAATSAPGQALAAAPAGSAPVFPPPSGRSVALVSDDAFPDPADMAARLSRLVARTDVHDSYLQGGAVEQLEKTFAALLGKEACAFLPTGTLANNLALRILCGENHHALCLYDSHLYRDESDAAPRLSGINLVPLSDGKSVLDVGEFARAFDAAQNGPYPIKVGAISLESPIRRLNGEMIPAASVAALAELARKQGTPMHLDGARLLVAPPGFDVRSYAAPFATVYVSLYKYLGAPFGAVLAGGKAHVDQARDLTHLYGGEIYQGWIPAVLALDRLKTLRGDMARAYSAAASLVSALQASGKIRVRPLQNPSNIMLLEMPEELAAGALERGRLADVRIGKWRDGAVPLYVNRSILRRPVGDYVRLFLS